MALPLHELVIQIDSLQSILTLKDKRYKDSKIQFKCHSFVKRLHLIKKEIITISKQKRDNPEFNITHRIQFINTVIKIVEGEIIDFYISKLLEGETVDLFTSKL